MSSYFFSVASFDNPFESTNTNPFIGRPVMYIGLAFGRSNVNVAVRTHTNLNH